MAGAPHIPAGPSAAEREALLEKEANLAEKRQEKARAYQEESERRREAIETQRRDQIKRTEEERIALLKEQEEAARDSGGSETDTTSGDTESKVVSMWSSLVSGVKPTGSVAENPQSPGQTTVNKRPL